MLFCSTMTSGIEKRQKHIDRYISSRKEEIILDNQFIPNVKRQCLERMLTKPKP